MLRTIFLIFLLSVATRSFSQGIQQPIGNNKPLYAAPAPKVYFTTDKEIYTPDELLWFSAYIFDNQLRQDTANVLTIGLYDALAEKMVVIKKFLIENRIATGNMHLPDTLFSGEYTLVAYTNLLDATNTPITKNFKPLRIYNRTKNKLFTTTLKIADSLSTTDKIAVLHEILSGSLRAPYKEVSAFYYSGEKPKKLPINIDGTGIVYINPKDINPSNRTLVVGTIYKEDTIRARIELPVYNESRNKYAAVFNPEGGKLIAGYNNTVFVELLKNNKVGAFSVVLLENGHPFDTIYTKANEQNSFAFKPLADHHYAMAVNFGDSIIQYNLPKVMAKGVKLTLPQTVVGDVLDFELFTKEKQALKVMLMDLSGTPYVHDFTIDGPQKMAISLNGFAPGLCNLSILDNSTHTLLANTYFFAHHGNNMKAIVQTSKDIYKTRDSIGLNLYVSGADGIPQNAVATISCALSSRVNPVHQKSIETDFVLDGLAYNEQAVFENNGILNNKPLLENIIRLKNISNADDEIVMDYNSPEQATLFRPTVTLYFDKYGNRVTKEVEMIMFSDTKFSVVKTNKKGIIELDTEKLLLPDGRKFFLKGLGKRNEGFTVFTEDALLKAHQNIKVPVYKPVYRQQQTEAEPANFLLTEKKEQFSKTLDEVIVKANKEIKYVAPRGLMHRRNACGDYVCENRILNCHNHLLPFERPVIGQFYYVEASGRMEEYKGCVAEKNFVEEKEDFEESLSVAATAPVYLCRPFLGMDSTLLKQTFQEYMSTICWMPFVQIANVKQNRIVFNSSDQEGVYLITVQGFAANGQPFFAQKEIRVED